MRSILHTSKEDETKPVYLIVPGFIGNYSEGFIKRLYDYLLANKQIAEGIIFSGHERNETVLLSLDEMVGQVSSDYFLMRDKYPDRQIIVLAHSQGCAVALGANAGFDENTSLILFSPAIFLDKLILPRISKEDMEVIERGQPVNCRISRDKFRTIDLNWVLSYRNFSLDSILPKVHQHCLIVRPFEDHIPMENIEILRNNLPNCDFLELPGDHTFSEPQTAFTELMEKVIIL